MAQLALKINMENEIESEARFFRNRLNSKNREMLLKMGDIISRAHIIIEALKSNEWQSWYISKFESNKIESLAYDTWKIASEIDDEVCDADIEVVRRSHKYTFGYCEVHHESYQKIWDQFQCETCFASKMQEETHGEFLGVAVEDR